MTTVPTTTPPPVTTIPPPTPTPLPTKPLPTQSGLDAVPLLGALALCGMVLLFRKNRG